MTTTKILGDNAPRKSNFDPLLAEKLTRYYAEHPEELIDQPTFQTSASSPAGECILMPQIDTYALGLWALQEVCVTENNLNHPKFTLPDERIVYRPNTFLENIMARINDYNTVNSLDGTLRSEEERLALLKTSLDSCCGLAYKKESTKLKLSLLCPKLIGIAKDFKGAHFPVDYASFPHQVELDISSPTFVRDGWMVLLEEKTEVYEEYLTLLKEICEVNAPNFYTMMRTNEDGLWQLKVGSFIGGSNVYGNYGLSERCRFLRRKP